MTKWGSTIIGFGLFFEIIGLSLDIRQSALLSQFFFAESPILSCNGQPCSVGQFLSFDLHTVMFAMFFYGTLFVGIGVSTLVFQHLRNHTSKAVLLLENQLD